MDSAAEMHIDQQWSMPQNSQKTSEKIIKLVKCFSQYLWAIIFLRGFQKIEKSTENIGKMILD